MRSTSGHGDSRFNPRTLRLFCMDPSDLLWRSHTHHGSFLRGNELPEEAQINLLDHCARLREVLCRGIRPGNTDFLSPGMWGNEATRRTGATRADGGSCST